jgi:hypothetical protein
MSLQKIILAEMKAPRSDADSNSYLEPKKRRYIIVAEPSLTITTMKVHPKELEDLEEGKHLFHSHLWVKGAPLHFIIDGGSQKNLISS